MSFHLYSLPTVDEFFDGIVATLANKAFNSPIAFPGFKPYLKKRNKQIIKFIFILIPWDKLLYNS